MAKDRTVLNQSAVSDQADRPNLTSDRQTMEHQDNTAVMCDGTDMKTSIDVSGTLSVKIEEETSVGSNLSLKETIIHKMKMESNDRRLSPEFKPTPESVTPQIPALSAGRNSGCSPVITSTRDTYNSWAYRNYSDSGKTKTVTMRKYNRIFRTLTGQELNNAVDNSKFRFWVKSKGFCVGLPGAAADVSDGEQIVYVPTTSSGSSERVYKRVAVVEDFYDIIFNVHVGVEGRGGKHAGQKRTYRAIAETYSFLPREAVTRFLMACSDCQKRMHLTTAHTDNNNDLQHHVINNPPMLDFSMPITTAYMHHMRGKQAALSKHYNMFDEDLDDTMSGDTTSDMSVRSNSPEATHCSPTPPDLKQETNSGYNSRSSTPANSMLVTPVKETRDSSGVEEPLNLNAKCALNFEMNDGHISPPSSGRKRKASDTSLDSSSVKNECLDESSNRDEEEDDDNDEEERMPPKNVDPERLKSFNMFVRLFVDENLDRLVPISKQPKDKIQAILDACDRQFPEFRERSRKRLRTYLKSCRRMRRSKEANGWEPLRPTPPHLTSAAAESMLATACENESNNAKRMRMGLEPLPATLMSVTRESTKPTTEQPTHVAVPTTVPTTVHTPLHQTTPSLDRQAPVLGLSADMLRQTPVPAFRPTHELHQPHLFTNGTGLGALFRPGFPPAAYPNPAHHHSQVIQHSPVGNTVQNGPTDLSIKTKNNNHSKKSQLNPNEIATIKQLISGYRESAAFLYRSADELETLLLQHN